MAKTQVNFSALWERLKTVAEMSGNERMKAVLMNYEGRKEYICRKLGVVSDVDVNRVADGMKAGAGARHRQGDRLQKRSY